MEGRNPFGLVRQYFRKYKGNGNNKGINLDLDSDITKIRVDSIENILRERSNKSYFDAHVPYSQELEKIIEKVGCKMIYIIRDPRDVAISYVNHMTNELSYPLTGKYMNLCNQFRNSENIKERLLMVLNGVLEGDSFVLAPLIERLERSIGWMDSKVACTVQFEELIGKRGGGSLELQAKTINKILDFLGIELTKEKRAQLGHEIYSSDSKTFHKGKLGQWKNIMEIAVIDAYEAQLNKVIVDMGYSLSRKI